MDQYSTLSPKQLPYAPSGEKREETKVLTQNMQLASRKFIDNERRYICQMRTLLSKKAIVERGEFLPNETHGLFRSVSCILKLQSDFLERIKIPHDPVFMGECWGFHFKIWLNDHADLVYQDFERRKNRNENWLRSRSAESLSSEDVEGYLALETCLELSSVPCSRLDEYVLFLTVPKDTLLERDDLGLIVNRKYIKFSVS